MLSTQAQAFGLRIFHQSTIPTSARTTHSSPCASLPTGEEGLRFPPCYTSSRTPAVIICGCSVATPYSRKSSMGRCFLLLVSPACLRPSVLPSKLDEPPETRACARNERMRNIAKQDIIHDHSAEVSHFPCFRGVQT